MNRNYRYLLVLAIAMTVTFGFQAPRTQAVASTPAQGWLDSCVSGWVLDTDTPSEAINVHIYIDKPAGIDGNSGFVASVKSTVVREDVNKVFNRPAGEAHGFDWAPSKSFYDGKAHKVYAYAIDSTDLSGGSNRALSGSPRECRWSAGSEGSGSVLITTPSAGEQWKAGTTHKIEWADTRGISRDFTYSLYLQKYIPCLYTYPTPCKIAERAPYTIAEHVTGSSFTWNIPVGLGTEYLGSSRVLIVIDNTDLFAFSGVFEVVGGGAVSTISIYGKDISSKVREAVEQEYTASGGTGKAYSWKVSAGSLPPGLVLGPPQVYYACDPLPNSQSDNCPDNTNRAVISGVPNSTGSYRFTLQVTDSAGSVGSTEFMAVILPVDSVNDLDITLPSNLTVTVGQAYSGTFSVTGGSAPYSWNLSGSTASGLSLKDITFNCITTPCVPPKTEVIVSGTPTATGSFVFNISATDSTGKVATKQFTVNVLGASDKTIRTGYVDVATGQRVEGWALDSTKPGACVTITYRSQATNSNDLFTQDVCPTMTRTDAADWLVKNYGSGYVITQPLGFRADPAQVLKPGTYVVSSVKLKDSGVAIELGESAKFPITVADTTVRSGPIIISSPAKGETWQVGQTKTIAWSGNNNLPVKISLQPRYNCNSTNTACTQVVAAPVVIANNVTASSYAWTIPDTLGGNKLSGDNYYIILETVATGVDYVLWGQSGAFNIINSGVSASPLFVSSPAAGAIVKAGGVTTIAWNVLADTQGLPVTLKYNYVNNPACLKSTPPCAIATTLESVLITSTAPNTGTYAWTVPGGLSGDVWVTVSMGGWTDDSDIFIVQGDVQGGSLVPGQIVKSSTGNTLYYITSGGSKYAFSSLFDFTSRGFSLRSIESTSQSVLDATPTTLIFSRVSGVSFKYRGANTVYYLNPSYCKEGYLGLASLRSWGVDFSAIYNIATDEQYPDCSAAFVRFKDNTIVRLVNNSTIYRYSAGSLHPFSTFEAFTRAGYTSRDILIMNQAEKDLYSVGDAIN